MKKTITLLVVLLTAFVSTASASPNSHPLSFQSFSGNCPKCRNTPCNCGPQGGYPYAPGCSAPSCSPAPCPPPCDPCAPCAPICGTQCGVSICAIGVSILAIVGAAAIILSSDNVH